MTDDVITRWSRPGSIRRTNQNSNNWNWLTWGTKELRRILGCCPSIPCPRQLQHWKGPQMKTLRILLTISALLLAKSKSMCFPKPCFGTLFESDLIINVILNFCISKSRNPRDDNLNQRNLPSHCRVGQNMWYALPNQQRLAVVVVVLDDERKRIQNPKWMK